MGKELKIVDRSDTMPKIFNIFFNIHYGLDQNQGCEGAQLKKY